ncbi:MAG: hypothetical protein Q8O67_32685 [Deltaproteobacteria bacterium]|nr:hypothetical protein [Deltaproteobacteria bacterium]
MADDDDTGRVGSQLVAERGSERIVIVPGVWMSVSDQMNMGDIYLSPDKNFIITFREGCWPEVFVFEIAALARQLAQAPTTEVKR